MTFCFVRDGVSFCVHSEVGDGAARVVVEERELHPEPESLESAEEEANG